MKKCIKLFIMVFVMLLGLACTANAATGDKIGEMLHTDIVAYINHYAIDSFAACGQSVITAEELTNYGFDVIWNETERTLTINRNSNTKVSSLGTEKWCFPGEVCCDILETDIRVFANGKQLTSYCIDGDVMIPIEELSAFGEVYWVEEERAIKLWIDGLEISPAKEEPKIYSTKEKLYQYLAHKYETIQTAAGVYVFDFTVFENTTIVNPYDYSIWTEFDFTDFYNLKYSTQFTQQQRAQAMAELKHIQYCIALDCMRLLPGKKLQGYYLYSNVNRSTYYHCYDWMNYTGSYGTDAYYKSKLSNFRWTNEEFLRKLK